VCRSALPSLWSVGVTRYLTSLGSTGGGPRCPVLLAEGFEFRGLECGVPGSQGFGFWGSGFTLLLPGSVYSGKAPGRSGSTLSEKILNRPKPHTPIPKPEDLTVSAARENWNPPTNHLPSVI